MVITPTTHWTRTAKIIWKTSQQCFVHADFVICYAGGPSQKIGPPLDMVIDFGK